MISSSLYSCHTKDIAVFLLKGLHFFSELGFVFSLVVCTDLTKTTKVSLFQRFEMQNIYLTSNPNGFTLK